MENRINVRELTEAATLVPLHIQVLAICFATAVIDGLDNQMIGFSATAIATDLKIPLGAFGTIFAAGTIGGLLGAMGLGSLADRFGRRNSLIICTALFALFTFATTLATSITSLLCLRFLAGVGIGGAMPGFLTIVSEYAPKKRRALATGLLWCGYPVGGMFGGILGSYFIPLFGWKMMFYLGAGLAALMVLVQSLALPESLQFLTLKGGNDATIRATATRLAPGLISNNTTFVIDRLENQVKPSIREVFAEGRAAPTIFLWMALFFTFMIVNFLVLWSPALFKTAGLSVSTAALLVALNNFAAIPSQAVTGHLIDKVGPYRLLPITYGLLAVAVGLLAAFIHVIPALAVLMVFIGFLLGPGIAGTLFLATAIYPSRIRSTGVGWAMGIGRSGQVVGALLIGGIVSMGAGVQQIMLGMSLPPLIALTGVILLGAHSRKARHGPKPQELASPQEDSDLRR